MNTRRMQTRTSFFAFTCCLFILSLSGCSYLFYPRASSYLDQAKGGSATETIENLIRMLENSTKTARGPQNYQAGMDDLHNQLHALDDAVCQVTKPQSDTAAYSKTTTLHKELWTIFKRLWRHRDDQAVREAHLDLFNARLHELRESLHAFKG